MGKSKKMSKKTNQSDKELDKELEQETLELENVEEIEEIEENAEEASEEVVEESPEEVPEEEPKLEGIDEIEELSDDERLERYERELEPFIEMKKEKKTKNPIIKAISRIFAVFSVIISGIFIVRLSTTFVLPAKYFYPILGLVALVELLFLIFTFKKHTKKVSLIIWGFFIIVFSVALSVMALKINEIFSFLEKNIENREYAVYNVVVKKDSEYNELSDLKNKELKTYKELIKDVSDEKLEKAVSSKIEGSTLKYLTDINALMNSVVADPLEAIVINNGTYESYTDSFTDYAEKVKIIATIEIEMDKNKVVEASPQSNLTNTPFIVYISGIDTRTDTMPTRSLSDVNILAVVNPNTKHIQLISIPRDAYVQLHGTTGLKDKLTHAGSRGGIALSQATIEDLYGISVDRYVRVNFNFVEQLVDAVGGIEVNSDVDYSFVTKARKCVINPGENYLNGNCAVGFARERKSYSDGDRHRGRNQLQVIEKLFEKITTGSTLLSKYSQILNSLDGTFDSNFELSEITSLVRMQLNNLAKWTIEDYSVNGTGAMTTTYSYPNQNLYVMYIDENTLNTAKAKINAVLNEK